MANKKKSNDQQDQELLKQQDQELQMQEDEIALQQAAEEEQQAEELGAVQQQELTNKTHDTEFTDFSDVNAENDKQQNLHVIGKEEVEEAYKTLLEYKEEKAELEKRISENEEFWKMNHWNVVYEGEQREADKRVKPRSGWLFNTIINKHADAMDNYPEPNILPRSLDDEDTAKVLSQIIPVILEQNDYENTYSETQWYKAKNGSSAQAILWNNDKNNGLGDIEIKKIDLLNIFWKGGISDIQDSPNFFHVAMMDNDEIKSRYPELIIGSTNSLGLTTVETYKNNVNTANQTAVIDWYYKKRVQTVDDLGVKKMKTVLHFCKFCNDQVIYASENDPNYADRGWYDHGLYPFVIDTLFPVEGAVCGMGYIDVVKDDQIYIDKLQQAILESAIVNSRPRYLSRSDGGINEAEFLDLSKAIVHVEGNIDDNTLKPMQQSTFNSVYETVYLNKISELKDTSGNTAASQGQASSVTSASGIASLQEAAGKLSRDANKSSYRAFKLVCNQVIELIRQFYNEPRCFRIVGEFGHNDYVEFDNSGLLPQNQGDAFNIDLGSRLPIMDVDVKPQKKNAYSRETQNQTALNFYNLGFFAPQNSDAALACLDMMDFDQIDTVKEKITQNGTLLQTVMQMQQQLAMYQQMVTQLGVVVDTDHGTNIAQQATADMAATQQTAAEAASGGTGGKAGSIETSKGSLSSQAASATRGSTSPR